MKLKPYQMFIAIGNKAYYYINAEIGWKKSYSYDIILNESLTDDIEFETTDRLTDLKEQIKATIALEEL